MKAPHPLSEIFWPTLEAFKAWARHVETLASSAPKEPIPGYVILIRAGKHEISEADRLWAEGVVARHQSGGKMPAGAAIDGQGPYPTALEAMEAANAALEGDDG